MSHLSLIGFHQGNTLVFLANKYPSVEEVLTEHVQNALDSGATRIEVFLSHKLCSFAVRDNGHGASLERFDNALQSIATSSKDRKTQLGRFGLGLISPIGKCTRHTFTSCPKSKPVEGYRCWTFETARIKDSAKDVQIPVVALSDQIHVSQPIGRQGKKQVWWWSEHAAFDVTTDRVVNDVTLESLATAVLEKYNDALLEKNASITIEVEDASSTLGKRTVRGVRYTGKKLPSYSATMPVAGRVQVDFYLARKRGSSKGINVKFGELTNSFRIPWKLFAVSIAGRQYLPDDLVEAIRSGIFEGDVLAEHVKIHESRRSLEDNEALMEMCIAFSEWFKNEGAKYLDEESRYRKEARYQELGLRSLTVIEALLKSPEYEFLKHAIEGFKFGTTGDMHTRVGHPVSQLVPAISTRGGPNAEHGDGDGTSSVQPSKEDAGHTPFSALGPNGKKRNLVRNNSLGLQVYHSDLDGSSKLWEMDCDKGVIVFNETHPDWVRVEGSDYKIRALQEFLIIQALTLYAKRDDNYAVRRQFADLEASCFVQLLHSGAVSRSVEKSK